VFRYVDGNDMSQSYVDNIQFYRHIGAVQPAAYQDATAREPVIITKNRHPRTF
jgi:hypothetical protein